MSCSIYARPPFSDAVACVLSSLTPFRSCQAELPPCRTPENRGILAFQCIPQTPRQPSHPGRLVSLRPSPGPTPQHGQGLDLLPSPRRAARSDGSPPTTANNTGLARPIGHPASPIVAVGSLPAGCRSSPEVPTAATSSLSCGPSGSAVLQSPDSLRSWGRSGSRPGGALDATLDQMLVVAGVVWRY